MIPTHISAGPTIVKLARKGSEYSRFTPGSRLGCTRYGILGLHVCQFTLGMSILACCMVSTRLPSSKTKVSGPWFDLKHLQDANFMLLVLGSIFVSLGEYGYHVICYFKLTLRHTIGLFVPNFYIVSYSTSHSLSPSLSFAVLAVLNGGGILGRLVPPVLSDTIGRFNLLIPSVFLAGLCTMVFWIFARTTIEIMLYAVLYGFFSGAFNALIIPCIAQISDIREIGVRIGILYSIISFS